MILGLSHEVTGYVHLAEDGVLRSYDGGENVIDYVRLNNAQIQHYVAKFASTFNVSQMDELYSAFNGVNGHDVVNENQLTNPPAWLRHRPQSSEMGNQSRSRNADTKAALQDRDTFCAGYICFSAGICNAFGCTICILLGGPNWKTGLGYPGICWF